MPKAPSDVRVCIPNVTVRIKNADQWNPMMEGDPGKGKVVSWEAGNASNGVRVRFEMGTLLCSPEELELVFDDDTKAALVEGILSHVTPEAVRKEE